MVIYKPFVNLANVLNIWLYLLVLQDIFHVYLNRSEFDFLWLHIIKTNKICFFMHNECVHGINK